MIKKKAPKEQQAGEAPLKKLRDDLDMSQEEFGRRIGVSARTVSRWEAGDSTPTFTVKQMKLLDHLLQLHGKSIQSLPDNFAADR